MRNHLKIQSDLNRAKGQLDAMEKSTVFSEEDRNDLRPKWQQTIKDLEDEYKRAVKEIKVNDPIRVGCDKSSTAVTTTSKGNCSTATQSICRNGTGSTISQK